jgi:hypothetical protein
MSTIIAGRFDNLNEAKQAETVLKGSAFDPNDICTFAVNPPGQHATFPIGGDEHADAGARPAAAHSVKGAALGGAVGLGAGAAVSVVLPEAPMAAIAGASAAVGAYTGSLAGALHGMGNEPARASGAGTPPTPRKAGILVAARTDNESARNAARDAFARSGAHDIEIANGTWREGKWTDFDPTVPPVPAQ